MILKRQKIQDKIEWIAPSFWICVKIVIIAHTKRFYNINLSLGVGLPGSTANSTPAWKNINRIVQTVFCIKSIDPHFLHSTNSGWIPDIRQCNHNQMSQRSGLISFNNQLCFVGSGKFDFKTGILSICSYPIR